MGQENQIQKFTCGNATFKNILSKNKEIIEKSQRIKSTLKNRTWQIYYGYYKKQQWKEIFRHMSECFAQQIELESNHRVQIITQIQYVQYSNLKKLSLSINKINNIQSLNFIHFNCLQWLDLGTNQISQIKCLNKLSTPSLNYFSLSKNPLIEINALTRSKINSKMFKQLKLQDQLSKKLINQDLSVIIKLNSESVESLCNLLINMRVNIRYKNHASQITVNVFIEVSFYLKLKVIKQQN